MKLGVGCYFANRRKDFFGCSRDEKVRTVGENTFGNLNDLLGGLALSEDNFRESKSQITMMIDARKRKIFIGQARHFVERFIDVDTARLDLLEQLPYSVPIHGEILAQE